MAERMAKERCIVLTPEYFLQKKQFNIWDCYSEERSNFNNRLHFHEFYELSVIYEGSACFLINGNEFAMGAGSIQLIRPSDYHSQMAKEGEHIRYFNLMFSADFLTSPLQELIEAIPRPLCRQVPTEEWPALLVLIRQMLAEFTQSYEDGITQQWLRCQLELICLSLLRNPGAEALHCTETVQEPIRRALTYIQKHYRRPLTLADAAAAASLSPSYFSTLFHQTIHTTFSAYLTGYRLQIAERYLRSSDLSVKQIASVCGFSSYPYFVSAFKDKYGLPPGRFRLLSSDSV